jgi:hypothetical protein
MRTKKDIQMLLESGLSSAFVAKLNDSQMKSLVERFKKESIVEQGTVPQNTTPVTTSSTKYIVKPNSKTMINGIEIDTTGGKTTATPITELGEDVTLDVVNDPDATADGMPTTEGEMSEKFESKAQQGFFWAKCNTSKGVKKKKWCELAREFSDKTTKKDYENMPDQVSEGFYDLFRKKTPNQIGDSKLKNEFKNFIVKYSKIKDIESGIEDWSDKKIIDQIKGYADMSKHGTTHNKRAKELFSKLFEKKKEKTNEEFEKLLEDRIVEMIERHIEPKMTKADILKTISEKMEKNNSMILRNPKKMSMFADESGIESKRMKKPTQMMPIMGTMEENETKEKERTKEKDAPTKPGTPPKRRGNPFKNPNPGVKEDPRGEKKNKEKMKQDFIGLINRAF